VLTLLRRTLERVGTLLLVLIGLLAAFEVALVATAVSFDESKGFDHLAGLIPSFLQHAFGPALASFAGMTSLGFFEPLIVMLVVQFAIFLATEPAGDVETGIVDLVLARPVPRHWLVTRSLIAMTGVTILLPATMGALLWISLQLMAPPEADWPEPRVVTLLMAHLAAVAWCFGGAALAAAAWARRRGSVQTLVGIAAVALYLVEVVAEGWPRIAWTARLSPFHHFHGAGILAGDTDPARDLAVLVGLGVVGVVVGYWKFQKRDV
jgi:hypothetical protein